MKKKPQAQKFAKSLLETFNALSPKYKQAGLRYLSKRKLTLSALKSMELPPKKRGTPEKKEEKTPEEKDDLLYNLYKQVQQSFWELSSSAGSPALQWHDLAVQVNNFLEKNKPIDRSNVTESLYPYNFLRELLGLPTKPTLQADDRAWFKTILPELELYFLVETDQVETPSIAHKKLLEEAIQLLNIQRKVYAAQHKQPLGGTTMSRSATGLTYIALCGSPDVDTRLSVLYHELGHVHHDDAGGIRLIEDNKTKPADLYNQPAFKDDLDAIARYLQKGIELVPTLQNTQMGKLLTNYLANPEVQRVFHKYGTFWIPPDYPDEYQKMIYYRGTEQRADLFALRNLLKYGMMSSILTFIDTFGIQREKPYLIAHKSKDHHPSGLERALYLLGYLADQGINVSKVLYAWENEGVCVSAEDGETKTPPSLIEQVYTKLKSEQPPVSS